MSVITVFLLVTWGNKSLSEHLLYSITVIAAPQRPVRVLPQTRRRGPAISYLEARSATIAGRFRYIVKVTLGNSKVLDLTIKSNSFLIDSVEYTCCPDVLIETLLSASKTLPAIVVFRFGTLLYPASQINTSFWIVILLFRLCITRKVFKQH